MRVLVYQHASGEGLGAFEEPLAEQNAEITVCRIDEGEEPADPADADLLIVLGGPLDLVKSGAASENSTELSAIRQALKQGSAVVGVCLGAQLLAEACGGGSSRMDEPEIGFYQAHITEEGKADPVFGSLPDPLPVFHWHTDAVDLPKDAVVLATREQFPVQAFRIGSAGYGLLFHLEVTPGMISDWITCSGAELTDLLGANLSLHDYVLKMQGQAETNQHVARVFISGVAAVAKGRAA